MTLWRRVFSGEKKDEIVALLQRRSVKWHTSDKQRSSSVSSNSSNPGLPRMMDPYMQNSV